MELPIFSSNSVRILTTKHSKTPYFLRHSLWHYVTFQAATHHHQIRSIVRTVRSGFWFHLVRFLVSAWIFPQKPRLGWSAALGSPVVTMKWPRGNIQQHPAGLYGGVQLGKWGDPQSKIILKFPGGIFSPIKTHQSSVMGVPPFSELETPPVMVCQKHKVTGQPTVTPRVCNPWKFSSPKLLLPLLWGWFFTLGVQTPHEIFVQLDLWISTGH